MPKRITVALSQAQGKNPTKRRLEEDILTALVLDSSVEVSVIPHLYDLTPDHTGLLFLRGVAGPLVVLGWLYPRAIRWILDRQGIKGHDGATLLRSSDEDDEEEIDAEPAKSSDDEPEAAAGIGSTNVPDRKIYCLDLSTTSDPNAFIDEIRRIASEQTISTVEITPPAWTNAPSQGFLELPLGPPGAEEFLPIQPTNGHSDGLIRLTSAEGDDVRRRWYPVIDYDRCTNCMECIDFCLFGVYGVDELGHILVEQQDNCKKGCPACSRVCPQNAILFPQHKTPAIAGAAAGAAGAFKIDLSKLFGGSDDGDPLEAAIRERDTELVRDGREAVGASVGIPKRRQNLPDKPRDELDDLVDDLASLDL